MTRFLAFVLLYASAEPIYIADLIEEEAAFCPTEYSSELERLFPPIPFWCFFMLFALTVLFGILGGNGGERSAGILGPSSSSTRPDSSQILPAGLADSAKGLLGTRAGQSLRCAATPPQSQHIAGGSGKKATDTKATFCPDCGGHWKSCMQPQTYTARDDNPPWKASWRAEEAKSPRRPRPSPRRHGKGQQKGKEAGEGAGKGKDMPPQPPSMDILPTAPAQPSVAVPKKGPTEMPPDPAKAQLEALLGALSSSTASLPPIAQQMIATMQESTAQCATRAMHKAVAEQAKSRQALAKVQSQRAAYLQSWHTYMSQLASLLESQVAEQAAILEKFDQSEILWSQADHQATQALARLAGAEAGTTTDPVERDMEVSEDAVEQAIEVEQKLQAATHESQQSAKKMVDALHEMRQSAEDQLQKGGREGSRTPRRTTTVEPTDENGESRDAKDGGPKAGATGAALSAFKLGGAAFEHNIVTAMGEMDAGHPDDCPVPAVSFFRVPSERMGGPDVEHDADEGAVQEQVRFEVKGQTDLLFHDWALQFDRMVRLVPEDFDYTLLRRPAALLVPELRALFDATQRGRYTVFEPGQRPRTRQCHVSWLLEDFVADAVGSSVQQPRSVQILQRPLAGLPGPHLVLTHLDAPWAFLAVPFDMRGSHGNVVTAHVPPAIPLELVPGYVAQGARRYNSYHNLHAAAFQTKPL
ncbi:unnamed protein product [Symbiodinium sp. CCMP2592]|nr:unnamed protein product [Symbiodinium sp. CCMP2592]